MVACGLVETGVLEETMCFANVVQRVAGKLLSFTIGVLPLIQVVKKSKATTPMVLKTVDGLRGGLLVVSTVVPNQQPGELLQT